MKTMIQGRNVSSGHTDSSTVKFFGGTDSNVRRTEAALIYDFSFYQEEEKVPESVRPVSSFIAEIERDPARAELLAQARKNLAETLYGQGDTLRSLRLKRGMSQAKLAELVGSQQPHIARIEAGRDVYMSTAKKIAEALGVDMNELSAALSNKDQLLPIGD